VGLLDAAQRILASAGYRTDLAGFLVVFGLVMARVATAVTLCPFLGGKSVSPPVKTGFSFLFTAVLLPGIGVQAPELSATTFVALLVKEALIGLTIGFLAQLIFYSIQMAGAIIDTERGMDQPGLFAPQLGSNVSALGQLKLQAALVVFLTMNGHLIFLRALSRSFEQLPLLGFPRFPSGSLAMAEQIARVSAQVFVVALQLAAPVLLALFLVDVCFGVLGKVAPGMNVFSESQPVKAVTGLAVLLLAVGFIFGRFEGVLSRFFWDVYRVLNGMA
jgi:flagellar biosynthetic protein FliR